MINDADKGYITAGPYQLIKQFVIRPAAPPQESIINTQVVPAPVTAINEPR